LAVHAQQTNNPVVGFLSFASLAPLENFVVGFRQGLKEAGFVDGQNVVVEYRSAQGRAERVPELAAQLVRNRVAVLVTIGGEPVALAAKAATATIPIVFNSGGDPVKEGLVASLNQPGGNATGVNIFTADLAPKRLGLLHDLLPQASLIAVLINPNFPPAVANGRDAAAAARAIGKQVTVLNAVTDAEIDAAFATMARDRVSAVIVGADPTFNARRERIVSLAARHALPAVYEWREFAAVGGLMSYGTNLVEAFRQQGLYAGQILKGAKPADLPVVQLTKFTFVINLKTARILGLTIPSGLLSIADEVIE
jgi:putative tryptophan/tyrosine transport system substrate-binding protein